MARKTFPPRAALRVVLAAVTVIALAAGPAAAQTSASGATASPRADTAACQASDLRISVPAAIPGDPAQGMGRQVWNVVFRNAASTACSLRGWPGVAVRTTAGKTVVTRVRDVTFSNLATVPDAQIILRPGQSAVVTATSPTSSSGCVTQWMLRLTLPGTARPVIVRQPIGPVVLCVGGQLQLSPFYAEQTLLNQVKKLKVSATPPPFPATTAPEPPVCTTAALRARVASATSGHGGSVIELRLGNAGGTCVLPDGWPTVRVGGTRGPGQVAKLFADTPALQAGRSLLTTYKRGTAQATALTLRHGHSVSVAVLATGTQACQRVTSVTVYPSGAASGPGRTARVTTPVSICGSPQILSYLPDDPGGRTAGIARAALQAVRADPPAVSRGSNAGFSYGTDSSAPTACGRGPYLEPAGSCARGTHGSYGEYIGEVGTWSNWQGCTSGVAWNQTNYNMANSNLIRYHTGQGAAAYWFAAGPGRDPHYNGTVSEAAAWGVAQAQQAMSHVRGLFLGFRYIFLDVENNGTAPDGNGWNTVWNGPCGSKVKARYIAPQVDYATFSAFRNYIDFYTPYLAGIYSAGSRSYGSWTGIFGLQQIHHTAEWTFNNEQAELRFPAGFSGSNASPDWFASAPASCHLLWQWSGGNGVYNGYGDFDQLYAGNIANPPCHP